MTMANGAEQTDNGHSPRGANAYIGMGANLAEPAKTLRQAMAELAAWPSTLSSRASSLYVSAPVDARGPDFVNAVMHLVTTLQPLELLHSLQRVEQGHGRTRTYRNAPRTLDLDLILYDNVIMNTSDLVIPHPRMTHRAFVLLPLAELTPELDIPDKGPLKALLTCVEDQAIHRLPAEPGNAEPLA
jgi:2-amino-4-hydroxy-6-hydroxymethyldihydropteridine diphosphokinase